MDRQYTPDVFGRVAMLLGGNGTTGTYDNATSEYFEEAVGISSMPTSPSGRGVFNSHDMHAIIPKSQGTDTRFGIASPYHHFPGEVQGFQGFQGENVWSPSPAQRSGSVLNPYINDSYLDRSVSQTPTLGSGSSPSESGRSEPSTQNVSSTDQDGQQQLPHHGRQPRTEVPIPQTFPNSTPSPKRMQKAPNSRPPRASEVKRERSKCYCEHGCKKTSKDGSLQPMSFTRQEDYQRHCTALHAFNPKKFHCQYCDAYSSTRSDKVKSHWRNKHKREGKPWKSPKAVARVGV